MQTTLILLPVIAAFSAGCFGIHVGNGRAGEENREVASFVAIDASGAYQLDVRRGSTASVRVTGDENLVPLIRTEVRGTTLRIMTEGNLRPDRPMVVTVVAPTLESVSVSGAVHATMTGVRTDVFEATASGASKMLVDGTARALELSASGASRVDASRLKTTDTEVRGSGAAHLKVNTERRLDGRISGACNLEYFGGPVEVNVETSGASSIKGAKRETARFQLPTPKFTVTL